MLRPGLAVRSTVAALCGWTLLACGAIPQTQPLLSAQTIGREVGVHYGDRQAVVLRASPDVTDSDGTPMYLMTVSGLLRKDGVQAHTVTFSALATRLYVWDIRAFDGSGQQVWSEAEWGACRGPCRTSTPRTEA